MPAFSFGLDANPLFAPSPGLPVTPPARLARSLTQWFRNRGETVFETVQIARLWRVLSGVLCLVQREHDVPHLTYRALPGEMYAGMVDATRAIAKRARSRWA